MIDPLLSLTLSDGNLLVCRSRRRELKRDMPHDAWDERERARVVVVEWAKNEITKSLTVDQLRGYSMAPNPEAAMSAAVESMAQRLIMSEVARIRRRLWLSTMELQLDGYRLLAEQIRRDSRPRPGLGTCPTCERVTYTVTSKNRLKSIEFADGVARVMCNGCRLAWYRLRDDGTEITWAEFQRRRKAGEHGNKYKPREKGWRGGPHPSVLRKQKAETP